VNETAGAAGAGRLEQVAGAVHVDGPVGRIRLARLPIGGGDVIHHLDAVGGPHHRPAIPEIPLDRLHAGRRER
jgi:hypothetical protein